MRTWLRLLPAVALLAACSDNSIPLEAPSGGGGGDSTGSPADGPLDGSRRPRPTTGDASTDFPIEILEPSVGGVISDMTQVRVRVTRGAAAPSLQQVKAEVTGGQTTILVRQSGAEEIYAGPYRTGFAPSGMATLTVTALAVDMQTRMASQKVLVNNGPVISIGTPGNLESRGTTVDLSVDVFPPFEGEVVDPTSVFAVIGGQESAKVILAATDIPNRFEKKGVSLNDGFNPPLRGETVLTVRAATMGPPVVTGQVIQRFVVDRIGPTITNVRPAAGELVAGVIRIQADISDPAGVDPAEVVAILPHFPVGDPKREQQLLPIGGNVYARDFDSRNFGTPGPDQTLYPVYPTLIVRARDTVGNPSSVGLEFALDNIPPTFDLTIPPFRRLREKGPGFQCSHLFWNLGADNINIDPVANVLVETSSRGQVFDVRAYGSDNGNAPMGTDTIILSGIDADSVRLLISLGDPLVEDSDGDTVCDRVPLVIDPAHPEVGDIASKARTYKMGQVAAGGVADFTPEVPPPSCTTGDDMAAPDICGTASTTLVVPLGVDGTTGNWGILPVATCSSRQFDSLAAGVPDGTWLCVVVQGSDKLGNVGVSAPERLCVSRAGASCTGAVPNCRKDACRARRVESFNEIRFEGTAVALSDCVDDGTPTGGTCNH